MGQSSLILVLMATLTVGILLYNAQSTATQSDTVLTVHQEGQFARETALIGLDRVVRDLVDRPDDWSQTTTFAISPTMYDGYGASTYQVSIHNYRPGTLGPPGLPTIDDTLDVRAIGTFRDREYTLKATYTKGYTNVGIPPALRHALVSDQTLRFNGSPEVRSSSTTTNADVHSNTSLDAQGSPVNFLIEGYGSFSESYDGSKTEYFQPNQTDPSVSGTTYEQEPLYVPTVDVAAAAATAHATTMPPPGSTTFTTSTNLTDDLTDGLDASLAPSSEIGKGLPTDPFVWYVGGNMVMDGSLRFPRGVGSSAPQGHITLYVNGDLTFQGTGTMTPTYSDAPSSDQTETYVRNWIEENLPEGTSLAIYVAGNVNFNGNVSVAALIHANGTVTFNGGGNKVNIIGSVVSKQSMTFNGNNKLWYTEASESVKDPGYDYDVPTGVLLLDYLEWPELPETP